MVPLCRRLIDPSLLAPREVAWIDTYHAEVREKTSGFFEGKGEEGKERALKWLVRETEKLG